MKKMAGAASDWKTELFVNQVEANNMSPLKLLMNAANVSAK